MIKSLRVQCLAVIENISLDLEPGFTVFTGETGAGKSLLVDALQLALGSRADSNQVRSGEQKAIVQMVIDLEHHPELHALLNEVGPFGNTNEVEFYREVLANGKSVSKIDNRTVPLSVLREISKYFVDMQGQHDHQALMDPDNHLKFLDAWIGSPATKARELVGLSHAKVSTIRRRLDAVRKGKRDWERELDMLRYQVQEIEDVAPLVGEYELLNSTIQKLKFSEKLTLAVESVLNALEDSEISAQSQMGQSIAALQTAAKIDVDLEDLVQECREAYFAVQEVVHGLRDYRGELEADPQKLEASISRLDMLNRLRRKYGNDEQEVLDHFKKIQIQLEDLESFDGDEDHLSFELDTAELEYDTLADSLSILRSNHSGKFSEEVRSVVLDLSMIHAEFEVSITRANASDSGRDRVEFLFSANPGESVRPLAKIASGGELSRVTLAIKACLAGKVGVPTLVFDEVDTGLSGHAASAVAKKLSELGKAYQVLVISHLPQTAASADHHLNLEKTVEMGRSRTNVKSLDYEERKRVIAKMIGGSEVSEAALVHAGELIKVPSSM